MMQWDTIQQLIRILMFIVGGYLGSDVVNGELYQAATGGVVAVAAFCWWWFWERNRA